VSVPFALKEERNRGMYQRIVVPLDGSKLAEVALPQATEQARLTGAPIHLLAVVDEMRLGRYSGPSGLALGHAALEILFNDEKAESAKYLEEIAARLKTSGHIVDSEVRLGYVAREIAAAARPDDLLVMASHGRGGLSRWLIGSVAEDVLRHASAPILLVKASSEPSED
jgi:nucleotide-binding universal stress UspA family protein